MIQQNFYENNFILDLNVLYCCDTHKIFLIELTTFQISP